MLTVVPFVISCESPMTSTLFTNGVTRSHGLRTTFKLGHVTIGKVTFTALNWTWLKKHLSAQEMRILISRYYGSAFISSYWLLSGTIVPFSGFCCKALITIKSATAVLKLFFSIPTSKIIYPLQHLWRWSPKSAHPHLISSYSNRHPSICRSVITKTLSHHSYPHTKLSPPLLSNQS